MSERLVTSDQHAGHLFLARLRGFSPSDAGLSPEEIRASKLEPAEARAAVEAHDQALVDTWNARVSSRDQIWMLGDVGIGNPASFLGLIGRLKGTKHLVSGNHDAVWPGRHDAHRHQREWLRVFASVQPFAQWKIAGRVVLLSHFPYQADHVADARHTQWRLRDEGRFLLHGHTHSREKGSGREIHVGWDAWGAPVSESEIIRIIHEREQEEREREEHEREERERERERQEAW